MNTVPQGQPNPNIKSEDLPYATSYQRYSSRDEASEIEVCQLIQKARRSVLSVRRGIFQVFCTLSLIGSFFQPFGLAVGVFSFLVWVMIWCIGEILFDFFAVYFYDQTLKHKSFNQSGDDEKDENIEPANKRQELSFSEYLVDK